MAELMEASRQWSSRPDDERFVSIPDALENAKEKHGSSRALVLSTSAVKAEAYDPHNLFVKAQDRMTSPTHYAFGQLCVYAGAPPQYMRSLPAPMAADCINWGLMNQDAEDVGVLVRDNGSAMLRAVTGPGYGRVWNDDVLSAILSRFGDGVSGDFTVPGIFGKPLDVVTKQDTTIYVGDHDMFVFLADEKNRIILPGEPDGLARGFFVKNSEVGAATLSVRSFLFRYACCNRIVWGAREEQSISIRHTSGAPRRFVDDVAPALQAYAQSSTGSIVKSLEAARAARIPVKGDESREDAVHAFLNARFSKAMSTAMAETHIVEEGRPIETLWDAAQAVTAYARGVPYQDERVKLETEGGEILRLAA